MQSVFDHPTIAHLAEIIERRLIEQSNPEQLRALLLEVEALSDDEAKCRLADEARLL